MLDGKGLVVFIDTDSSALNYKIFLDRLGVEISEENKEECVRVCLEIDKTISKIIEEHCDRISQDIMLTENMYKFETEEIFDKLLITSKKKYIARSVFDKTTNQYPEEDYTIKGMEFKKSNLSKPIKNFLKETTISLMNGMTERELTVILRKKFDELPNLPIDDISYVQGVRNIWKYSDGANICIQDEKNAVVYFVKRTPYHIAGALSYNALVDFLPELRGSPKVQEGEKGKIVFVNPTNCLGVKALTLPLHAPWNPALYRMFALDVEYMFNRLILNPLNPTLEALKFNVTLDSILGFKFLDSDNKYTQLLLF